MPSETDHVDPLVVAAPKRLNYLLVAVISFLVPPAGLIMAIGYAKKVAAHNKQIDANKVSARNYWLAFSVPTVIAIALLAYVNRPSNSLNNMTFTVVGTGPVAPSVQPTQAAPSVAAVAPEPVATNPVASGSVQPVASSTKELIGKIEAYRFDAFKTSDLSMLDKYYPNHQAVGWQYDRTSIVTHKNAGLISTAITSIDVYTVSSSKITALVTRKYVFADSGKTTSEWDSSNNTYGFISGRWYLTSFK